MKYKLAVAGKVIDLEPIYESDDVEAGEVPARWSAPAAETHGKVGIAVGITEAWNQGIQGFIEAGRRLVTGKSRLDHGQFLAMVRTELPFSHQTANKLMAIAVHPTISNDAHVRNLPASWGTLYELTKWEESELEYALSSRRLAGDTKRADLKDIRKEVRFQLRLKGNPALKTTNAKTVKPTKPIQFFARMKSMFDPEQIVALNSLDEKLANDLCVEMSRIIDSKLEESHQHE